MDLEYHDNILCIDNYKQIKHLSSDLIVLEGIEIRCENMHVLRLDAHQIVVRGCMNQWILRAEKHDIQNQNEQGRLF